MSKKTDDFSGMVSKKLNECDYKIALHRMCQTILLAISKFKQETGEAMVEVRTTDDEPDEELNEATGKFVKGGNKLGIYVDVTEFVDDDDDDFGDDDE